MPAQAKQETPLLYRWLKVLRYGLLALGSLLFSILCFLSVAGAPLGVLNLGVTAYPLINTIINLVGLISLGIGAGMTSFWSFFKGLQKKQSIPIKEEISKVKPAITQAITQVEELQESLKTTPDATDKAGLQRQRYQELSTLITPILIKLNVLDNPRDVIRLKALQPLWQALSAYNAALKQLNPAAPAVFYYPATLDARTTKLLLEILLLNKFEAIEFQTQDSPQTRASIVQTIKTIQNITHKRPQLLLTLPSWIKETPYQDLYAKSQAFNLMAALNNWLRQASRPLRDLHNNGAVRQGVVFNHSQETQLSLSNYIETVVMPFLDDVQLTDDKNKTGFASKLPSEMKTAAKDFDKRLLSYQAKLKELSSDNIFYPSATTIKKYTQNTQLTNNFFNLLVGTGFTRIDLTQLEEGAENNTDDDNNQAILTLINYCKDQNVLVTWALPDWFIAKNKTLQLITSSATANLNSTDVIISEDYYSTAATEQDLSIVPLLHAKKQSPLPAPLEPNILAAWWKKLKAAWLQQPTIMPIVVQQITGEYQKNKLREVRMHLLMVLGLLDWLNNKTYAQLLAEVRTMEETNKQELKRRVLTLARSIKAETHPDWQLRHAAKAETVDMAKPDYRVFNADAFDEDKKKKANDIKSDIYELCNKVFPEVEQFAIDEIDEIASKSQEIYDLYHTQVKKISSEQLAKALKARDAAQKQAEDARQAREAAEQQAADERKGRLRAEFYAKFNDFEILRHRTSDDNNSQFQAVQHAYNQVSSGSGSSTVDLRQRVIAYIKANDAFAKEFLGDDASPYLNQLAQSTTAGDAVSLTALAKILGHAIVVLKPSGNENQLIHVEIIYPRVGEKLDFDKALLLIFDGEKHYDSCKLRGNEAFKEFITTASLQQSQNMLTKPLINRGYHQQAGAGAEARAGAASSSQNQVGQQFTHSFTS